MCLRVCTSIRSLLLSFPILFSYRHHCQKHNITTAHHCAIAGAYGKKGVDKQSEREKENEIEQPFRRMTEKEIEHTDRYRSFRSGTQQI